MNSRPLVSAIIPAYNRPKRLSRAIQSVIDQDYPNLELIVVDDASTEDQAHNKALTGTAGGNYQVLEKNSGPAVARNTGRKIARGQFLAFLDSDDYWRPKKISKQIEFHQQNPDIQISQAAEIWYRNNVKVNPSKKHLMPSGDVFELAVKNCVISSSSVFMYSDLYDRYGGYPEEYYVCEDYALWLKITANHQLGLLDEKLCVKYGGHPDQLSRKIPAMDRFRLSALLDTYTKQSLNDFQKEILLKEIIFKCEILIKGAIKYNRDSTLYKEIKDLCSAEDFSLTSFDYNSLRNVASIDA